MSIHEPVLLQECAQYLLINNSGFYFDGTAGFGGHAEHFLSHLSKEAKYLATDKDINAFNHCQKKFEKDERITLFHAPFTEIRSISKIEFIDKFDGIFADLGVSSFQLDDKNSGFTYREDSTFDLRMDKSKGNPAYFYLNHLSQSEIADLIFKYGEEKNSRKIARLIVEKRKEKKLKSSNDLKNIISAITPERFLSKTLSRVFQAFRIYVNNELEELEEFLDKSIDLLKPGGRIVILSYHSLEDRIVKEKFKYENLDCVCPPEIPICNCDKERRLKIITKKPITAGDDEIKRNRRSRSVKLRVAERI